MVDEQYVLKLFVDSAKWLYRNIPWQIWFVFGLFICVQIFLRIYKYYRLLRSNIRKIDKMDGKEFEKYLELIFKNAGYKVINTPHSGDYGGDLLIEKKGEKSIVQAKRYQGLVGLKAVQEAYTSKNYYGCTSAIVITNSYFTKQAKTLAEANGVILWDRDILVKYILKNR
jgi:restriction system protein